jgi:hypothetical protein
MNSGNNGYWLFKEVLGKRVHLGKKIDIICRWCNKDVFIADVCP